MLLSQEVTLSYVAERLKEALTQVHDNVVDDTNMYKHGPEAIKIKMMINTDTGSGSCTHTTKFSGCARNCSSYN